MKKVLKISFIVFIVISILIHTVVLYYLVIPITYILSYDKNLIPDHMEEYTQAAKICYEDFIKHDLSQVMYGPAFKKENQFYILPCTTLDNYDIFLNDEEYALFKVVQDTFRLDKQSLYWINVYDTFVSFGTINGRNSYVYSVDGKKPSHVNFPDEKSERAVYTKKITDHWYYVCMPEQIKGWFLDFSR